MDDLNKKLENANNKIMTNKIQTDCGNIICRVLQNKKEFL